MIDCWQLCRWEAPFLELFSRREDAAGLFPTVSRVTHQQSSKGWSTSSQLQVNLSGKYDLAIFVLISASTLDRSAAVCGMSVSSGTDSVIVKLLVLGSCCIPVHSKGHIFLTGFGEQRQVLEPQTARMHAPACAFGGAAEEEYDGALVKRMLAGSWLGAGFGCRTVQYMLRHEASKTFVLALTVNFPSSSV